MYDIEFFLSHKCLGKNRTFVCNKFAEIDIKLSKCVLLTQCLIFCSKLQIWKRTIASRPINCSWNCRTKINNTDSCCNVDIGLMWVEQQRSVIWVNHRAHFPGEGHSFNHCVARNNTSWATEAQWTGPSELEGSFLKKDSVATPKLTLCCLTKIKANSAVSALLKYLELTQTALAQGQPSPVTGWYHIDWAALKSGPWFPSHFTWSLCEWRGFGSFKNHFSYHENMP